MKNFVTFIIISVFRLHFVDFFPYLNLVPFLQGGLGRPSEMFSCGSQDHARVPLPTPPHPGHCPAPHVSASLGMRCHDHFTHTYLLPTHPSTPCPPSQNIYGKPHWPRWENISNGCKTRLRNISLPNLLNCLWQNRKVSVGTSYH